MSYVAFENSDPSDAVLSEVPVIVLENVTRLYGTVIGVNDLQLSLKPGAYGLVGPNGAGKSTVIGLLTGALRPSDGRVSVFGRNPANHGGMLNRVGVCAASELLLPRTSALAWIVELLMLAGFSHRTSRQLARQALERVGMGAAMNRPVDSYSLGMRQRVKLAQAIAHQPDLLILDEPFNGLDPVGRWQMTELLKDWVAERKSLILASHVLSEVEAVTDSFLLIYGGRLLASGTSGELREMVASLPLTVTFHGADAHQLAGRLAGQPWVDSVSLSLDRNELRVTARRAAELYAKATKWIAEDQLEIDQMRGDEGGLGSLLEILTRRHRGFAQ